MKLARLFTAASIAFCTSALAGCAADTDSTSEATSAVRVSTPVGLTVTDQTSMSVRGIYETAGSKVTFELVNRDGKRSMNIASANDELLVQSVSTRDTEEVTLFGGRLRMFGPADAPEPTFIGDRNAPDELAARSEAPAVEALPGILEATFPTIFALDGSSAVAPKALPCCSGPQFPPPGSPPPPKPRPDLYAFRLQSLQSFSFVAWKTSQAIDWQDYSITGYVNCVGIKRGTSAESKYCAAYGHVVGSWYGQTIKVRNALNSEGFSDDLFVSVY